MKKEKKNELNKLRTVLWCRFFFDILGIKDPKVLNSPSLRSSLNGDSRGDGFLRTLDESFSKSEQKLAIKDLFVESDTNWGRHFNGSQSLKTKYTLILADKVAPGSYDYYEHGPFHLFDMLEATDAITGWECLKTGFISYVNTLNDKRFIIEDGISTDDAFGMVMDKDSLNLWFRNDWERLCKKLVSILPKIKADSYHQLENQNFMNIVYLELLCASFLAKFTAEPERYDWLGRLLFAELDVGLVYQLEKLYRVPPATWFNSVLFRQAAYKVTFHKRLLPEESEFIQRHLLRYSEYD
jgi:hypothetical protein